MQGYCPIIVLDDDHWSVTTIFPPKGKPCCGPAIVVNKSHPEFDEEAWEAFKARHDDFADWQWYDSDPFPDLASEEVIMEVEP